jgi:hypothetical protein
MSLLTGTKGNWDTITIYPEIAELDADGNTRTRPDWDNGYAAQARLQVQGQSGTSARRAEQDNEGYETEKVYRMRLINHPQQLGAQAVIEWHGERWALFGDVNRYNSSPRTAHHDYTVKRF